MRLLWGTTSIKNVPSDALSFNSNYPEASKKLSLDSVSSSLSHISSLIIQGPLISCINSVLDKWEIKRWSSLSMSLPDSSLKFVRKALQQQLATAANMQRWHRTASNLCILCNSVQTNKHVLSNCSFPGSLSRYTDRHNAILKYLSDYINSVLPSSFTLYVDLPNSNPICSLFNNLRPDLAILSPSLITVFELTVCHETNLKAAKLRKVEKYKNLNLHLNPQFSNFEVKIVTVEVSVLGFISDLTPLLKLLKLKKLPVSLLNNISLIAINHSKDIYFNRDNSSSSPLG
jgi:hypothetical protein